VLGSLQQEAAVRRKPAQFWRHAVCCLGLMWYSAMTFWPICSLKGQKALTDKEPAKAIPMRIPGLTVSTFNV